MTSIVWFRQDLRIADNPALLRAAEAGPVIPLYILDDETPGPWKTGAAARWWLHHSLKSLGASLAGLGAPLVLRRGAAPEVLAAIVRETGAERVFAERMVEPWAQKRDNDCTLALRETSAAFHLLPPNLLFAPGDISTGSGGPFRVFTPFHRKCMADIGTPRCEKAPDALAAPSRMPKGDALASWHLPPRGPAWADGFKSVWKPGEEGAGLKLERFLADSLETYAEGRNRPDLSGTSMLSPHLSWGEMSVRQVWNAAGGRPGCDAFLREIVWREFCHHLLSHFPHLPERPLNKRFESLAWEENPQFLVAWQKGLTGYPIVDAGMRQLWKTGWMHNRVRMIAASFLVKDGLLPWTSGEKWFWNTLVESDLASNAANWQWIAGCGADAAPFFRIFNPASQGERFDPDGIYVRTWVPELGRLPSLYIHAPWLAPKSVLAEAGVRLGENYPRPILDHAEARARALMAFRKLPPRL